MSAFVVRAASSSCETCCERRSLRVSWACAAARHSSPRARSSASRASRSGAHVVEGAAGHDPAGEDADDGEDEDSDRATLDDHRARDAEQVHPG
jgi:hypothetical protein